MISKVSSAVISGFFINNSPKTSAAHFYGLFFAAIINIIGLRSSFFIIELALNISCVGVGSHIPVIRNL